MHGPFPEELDVPYGTTNTRLILGVVPWVGCLLIVVGIAPWYLWGWRKGWLTIVAVLIGWALATPIREDPEILEGVAGEMQLKDWYE